MRLIKFRAYDTQYKVMCSTYDLWINGDGDLYEQPYKTYDTPNQEIERIGKDRYILMQFTGLLDAKGQEIYEGDRCDVRFASGETHKAEVVFVDGCFELHFYHPVVIGGYYNDRDYLKCSTVNHAVEIIGNIYEGVRTVRTKNADGSHD